MTKTEIADLAESIVRPELDGLGFDRMIVREAMDSTDDPSLFLDVFLKPGSGPVPSEVSSRVRHALSQKLLNAGEARFPYLRLRHPDDEEPEGPTSLEVH